MSPRESNGGVLSVGGGLGSVRRWVVMACGVALGSVVGAVGMKAQTMKAPDITKVPTLYVVPYAHLDTQWRWEFPQSISEYLLKTMRVNFDYMDKYPHYVFNWTGANRYRLMKEYYPADYKRMQAYAAKGRWIPAGSSVEEGDVNLPGAEGIFRQILYGNKFYRKDFGMFSDDYMLPDCFGFPASLPSILAHAGVKGFSTQKLNAQWQPATEMGGPDSAERTPEGIPFNVGLWTGPDGTQVLAALNPGTYNGNVYTDISKAAPARTEAEEHAAHLTREQRAELSAKDLRELGRIAGMEPDWVSRINRDGEVTGVFADYHYVGTGDIGGATRESTVKLLEAIVTKSETVLPTPPAPGTPASAQQMPPTTGTPVRVGDGPVHVVEAKADQMFQDITPAMQGKLPTYRGDLELINHSAGSLTSEAYHKRWVMKNELMAEAAEKTSVAAMWMGGRTYPQERLNEAWVLALGGHFHDTAAGTATPRTYEFAWNDDVIVGNQFGAVFQDAVAAVASGMDTRGAGTPLVVFNPLNIAREDVVEAKLPEGMGDGGVRVMDGGGTEVASQVEGGKVVFVAKVPSVGFAVYHVVAGAGAAAAGTELTVTENSLENARYRVEVNGDGDVSRIYDKELKRELLSGPMRMAISTDRPQVYPAWNMDFDQEQAAPRSYVGGPVKVRIAEQGPVRVALEMTREGEGSKFVQTVSLAAGSAGDRVQFGNAIDWKTLAANLKVVFPLTATNEKATYNWDVGTVERETAQPRQFEVASHRWIDLTDKSGSFGATILTDYKNGSDKRTDNTIRLTLMRSPGIRDDAAPGRRYTDQENQDWGHHEIVFGLAGHANGWREAQTDWQAQRLHDPLVAFETTAHAGELGKSFSLLTVSNPRVRVMALKKAELSDEVVLRMVELDGKPAEDVRVSFAGPIASGREITAQEDAMGAATVEGGALVTSFKGYEPKTFALKLGKAPATVAAVTSEPVTLQYDLAAASKDDTETTGGGFDGQGRAYPAEMLPSELMLGGVRFQLGAGGVGTPDAVVAKGQTIALKGRGARRVWVLASAIDGDQKATFMAGGRAMPVTVENWTGFIGQWDDRQWKPEVEPDWAISAGHAVWPPENFAEREKWPTTPSFPGDYLGLKPGYVKPATLAWYASHLHTAKGLNQPYAYTYLFAYAMDVKDGEHSLTLPKNDKVRIFAVSTTLGSPEVTAAQPLWDTLGRTEPGSLESAATDAGRGGDVATAK